MWPGPVVTHGFVGTSHELAGSLGPKLAINSEPVAARAAVVALTRLEICPTESPADGSQSRNRHPDPSNREASVSVVGEFKTMNVTRLATSLALISTLSAVQVAAQVAAPGTLRLPGAMVPVGTRGAVAAAGIQQPAEYATASVSAVQQVQQPLVQPSVAQPGAVAPSVTTTSVAQPVATPGAASVQQPSTFSGSPATNALLQQPGPIGPPISTFANYYDEDEDEEEDGDEEGEDDDLDLDGCGDDVGCGDGDCEPENTCCGFEIGGWIQQGFTYNPYDPADGNNGTVVLNDLANQYMMNQFWLYANRDVDNGGCGWDWGGRFDILYGTDAEYFQMVDGLEESWGQDGHYQFAILRFYYDIAFND
jgi:Putative beta-barrel porin-2, OmpL-like. bbp2